MSAKSCGCATSACGCCEGTTVLTPAPIFNRPGLPSLEARVGTHGEFLASMKARLAATTVTDVGADGMTVETFRPLEGLTTRDEHDPAIALLDGWASVADVLTFYQERIADEGYLRTATERRSVLELAKLVGYAPRPGVASSVYLAYTLDDNQHDPVTIPAGSRSQSVPGPDELPQSFETSEPLVARTEWNDLHVRTARPLPIEWDTILELDRIYVRGTTANLKAGDALLFVFDRERDQSAVRTVASAEAQFADDRTLVKLAPVGRDTLACLDLLDALIVELDARTHTTQPSSLVVEALAAMRAVRRNLDLGLVTAPLEWVRALRDALDGEDVDNILEEFEHEVRKRIGLPEPQTLPGITDPSRFVRQLLKPRMIQPRSGLQLARSVVGELGGRSDAQPQLLIGFVPQLRDTYFRAWKGATVSAAVPLEAVYVLRVTAATFGATASKLPTYTTNTGGSPTALNPPSQWDEWDLESDEVADGVFLDQAYEGIDPDGLVVVQRRDASLAIARREVFAVESAATTQRAAYGLTGKSSRIGLSGSWRPEIDATIEGDTPNLGTYRSTLVLARSEPLALADAPIDAPVSGATIELGALYDDLKSGRWAIVSGELADVDDVDGVRMSELAMLARVEHGYSASIPGDRTHTTLHLATPLAFAYKRKTVSISANVVPATHGETKTETLGSGDAALSLQRFELKQPPVTYVSAPTASGARSTLKVVVDDVEWHETETLVGLGPRDRKFVTERDDDGKTSVIFGTGTAGSRLPTGMLNVRAVYRSGIGAAGNVRAGQISLLQTRPLGVKDVVNPLRASGGADPESRDEARANTPLAVMALDRLVSVRDYGDFSRTFAGVGKASARRLSDGRRQIVHVTVAGAANAPIDPASDLMRNLRAALNRFGDPALAVRVDGRELLALVVSARVRLTTDFQWDPVATAMRAALLARFGFDARSLGQSVQLCEIVACIQGVRGVAWVDVDAFGAIPETVTDQNGARRLVTLDEIAARAAAIAGVGQGVVSGLADRVVARPAELAGTAVHPAELAIFLPNVPGTIVLNQIW